MVLQLLGSIVDQDIKSTKSSHVSFDELDGISFLLQVGLNEMEGSKAICLLLDVGFCILSI